MTLSRKLQFNLNSHERLVESIGRQRGSRKVFELIWSKLLPWSPESTALDVGCGKHGWGITDYTISCCDITPEGPPGYTQVAPEEPLPYETDQFDVSMAIEVLEHTENAWFLVRELCRVAKRLVIVSTPNPHCKVSKHLFDQYGHFADFSKRHNHEIGHWNPIFEWQLEEMARRSGWNVLSTHMIGGPFGDLRVPPGSLDGAIVPLLNADQTERTRVAILAPT